MQAVRIVVLAGEDPAVIAEMVADFSTRPGFAIVLSAEGDALVEQLARHTDLPVSVVTTSAKLEPDRIYVVPSPAWAVVRDGEIVATADARGGRVDRLLRTLADARGRDALAVILGCAGNDGMVGIRRIKELGGVVLVEQPPTGKVGELARAAVAAGLIDQVILRADVADRVVAAMRDDDELADTAMFADAADTLREILTLLRIRSGHDFNAYKRATLYRRVARRMRICATSSLGAYHAYLREQPAEVSHLLRDVLVSVTNFFRDADAFEALETQVIPQLFAKRPSGEPVRVWVGGCATGEEAYSIAMLLLEHASKRSEPWPLQIFATDIDEDALLEAATGCYPETIAGDVSAERLARFFVREAGLYRVGPELREAVLFSTHSLMRDPPFARLDLVSCRNLLGALERDAQQRLLSMFHVSLRPEGVLFLGATESAESSPMFSVVDAKHRVYRRRAVSSALDDNPPARMRRPTPIEMIAMPEPSPEEPSDPSSDLHNLVASTDIAVVFLDRALDLKRFTPRARDLFDVTPADIGRPFVHVIHRLETDELHDLARSVLHTRGTIERDIASRDGRCYRVRLLPYRSLEDRVDGVVLSFSDVSDLREAVAARKRSEAALAATEARLGLALRGAPVVALSVDANGHVTWGYLLGREVGVGAIDELALFSPDHARQFAAACSEVLASSRGQRLELDIWVGEQPRTYDFRIDATGMQATAIGYDTICAVR